MLAKPELFFAPRPPVVVVVVDLSVCLSVVRKEKKRKIERR